MAQASVFRFRGWRLIICVIAALNAPLTRAEAVDNAVSIDNYAFHPATLTVAVGATVTWINRDDTPHTVVEDATTRVLKSPPLDSDDKFSFTFKSPGTYKYFCSLHPHMQGTVIVK